MSRYSRRQFLTVSGGLLGGIAAGTTVTASEFEDRFIVKTRGKKPPRNLEVVHDVPGIKAAVVRASEKQVSASKDVKDYAPDIVVELDGPDLPAELSDASAPTSTAESTDTARLYPLQWDKRVQDIPKAHEVTRGKGTRVAVIDDGIFAGHPDLNVNEELSVNFSADDNGTGALFDDHGTHVAGTIAASGIGVVGSAPAAELVDLRVFSGSGASFGSIVAAVAYAAAIDADVANLSLGAYPVPRQGLGSFYGGVLNKAMTFANKEGTLLVIAAGNDEANLQNDKNLISLPNEGAQGLSVAATGPEGFLFDDSGSDDPPESPAFYTNYGTNAVDLGAPGGDLDLEALEEGSVSIGGLLGDWVLSTGFTAEGERETADLDGDGEPDIVTNKPDEQVPSYVYKLGTSMAAPQVAGAAALVKSANPRYNANQVEAALKRAASVPDGYDKAYYGAGFVNVLDAL